MAIEMRIDAARGVVLVTAVGEVSGEELGDAGKALIARPDYDPKLNSLWDLRALEFVGDVAPLRTLAEFVKQPGVIEEPIRAALVVSRDLEFGIARLFQSHADEAPVKYQVFRDMDEARAWVGAGDAEPS